MEILCDPYYLIETKINIIKNSNGTLISDTFAAMVYMLNEFQMNARLVNFKNDLEDNKSVITFEPLEDVDE